MTRFSKGIGCTGGSAVEAQAEGALTASCRVAWAKPGCAESVLAKKTITPINQIESKIIVIIKNTETTQWHWQL